MAVGCLAPRLKDRQPATRLDTRALYLTRMLGLRQQAKFLAYLDTEFAS